MARATLSEAAGPRAARTASVCSAALPSPSIPRAGNVLLDGTSALRALTVDAACEDQGEGGVASGLGVNDLLTTLEASLLPVLRTMGASMKLALANDERNIRKVRAALRSSPSDESVSALLALELAKGVHTPSPADGAILADPSAAIALTWLARSLDFISTLMTLLAESRDPAAAYAAAYASTVCQYHGFVLRSVFGASAKGVPSFDKLMRAYAPTIEKPAEREALVLGACGEFRAASVPVIQELRKALRSANLVDTRKV